ncbi:MAG: rhomboid family intramembrane serine protease [Thermonemataceae bacterium]|nr:rhomboid family intramembrane serine protease [Thermonemataceae bacterium]
MQFTPTVRILLILNVVAFLLSQANFQFAIINFALWDIQTDYFQPFQLLTHIFMHADFFHLLSNMLGLFFFGAILEQVLGQNRFLALYLVCGLGAGALSLAVDYYRIDANPMIGASGAVFGIVTSFALIFPNMPLQMLFPPISLKAKYMVLLYIVFELSYSFQSIPGDNVAHFTHLAGMLFAFVMIKLFWKIPKKY